MKRISIFIIILSAAFGVYGQKPVVSGYLGKTMYAKMRFATGITFGHPNKSMTANEVRTSNSSDLGLSLKREFFEVAFGKVMSNHIGLELNVGAHSMAMDYENISFYSYGSPYDDIIGYPKVSDFHTGIQIKLYSRKRGAIAPMGFYHGFQLNYHTYKIDLEGVEGVLYDYSRGNQITDLTGRIEKYKGYDLNWAMGMNRTIGEFIMLDIGLSTGVSLGLSQSETPTDIVRDWTRATLRNMLARYYFNKVYLGIGYMF